MSEPRIEDIPGTEIDVGMENDRFERWYCWSRCLDLASFRNQQAQLKAEGRLDTHVHHLHCMWLNAKRDAANQRKRGT